MVAPVNMSASQRHSSAKKNKTKDIMENKDLKKNQKKTDDISKRKKECPVEVQHSVSSSKVTKTDRSSSQKNSVNRKDSSCNTKTPKKDNERLYSKNSGKNDSLDKAKTTAVTTTEKKCRRKIKKGYESTEKDFSKIEKMIFESQEVSKKSSSQKEKGKSSKGSHVVEEKRSKAREDKKTGSHSKSVKEKDRVKSYNRVAKRKSSACKGKYRESVNASESDMSDWEEVDEACGKISEMDALLNDSHLQSDIKVKSVKIELDAPDVVWGMKKRKRRNRDEMIEDYVRKHLNRSIKGVYESMHKTHLLCLFAHGQYINRILNSDILLGSALSLIIDKNAYPPKRLDMNYLGKFVNWFSKKITVKIHDLESDYWSCPLESLMAKRFENKTAYTNREHVFMFIVMARALGLNVRLVISLQPMTWKPSTDTLIKRFKEEEEAAKQIMIGPSCSKTSDSCENEMKEKKKSKNSKKMLSTDSDHEIDSKKKKSSKIKKKKLSSLSDENGDSDFDPCVKIKKGPKASVLSSKKRKSCDSIDSDGAKKRKNKDENIEDKGSKKRKSVPLLEWAEVYVEEEEKWICVDITRAKLHCIPEIEARTPSSSAYITAFNANLTAKDVTRRYIASWLSNENKLRCCSKWWERSLQPFRGKRSRLEKEEDNELDQILQKQPMPKVIGEYKNHPLYALQRHLLKFEAIYPPDEGPVGYIKGEPVYSRSSVYTLCSRDTWIKEAKMVRVGEEPYKIVKARPKWDRNTCQVIKDIPLEVFGEWQVEDYEPPVASGGKVPRNEYGNVELFKPSMLPIGCVHLPLPGLNRVARKLNIDCASAMVGFDFHSGWTHPVYDGFVVCEEFKDILMDAWTEDQAEQAKRAEEKRQKRVYDNWKRLIHGMMVKEHVREKYGSVLIPETEDEEQRVNVETPVKDQPKRKSKVKGEKKCDPKQTKVTQEDIDAVRPPLVTHSVQNLKIDLTSNIVDMAKESRRKSMKTNNSVKVKQKREKEKSSELLLEKGNLGDSSDETDEEEKKEKIRAVLKWGTNAITANPDLSDSDQEGDAHPSKFIFTSSFNTSTLITTDKQKKMKRMYAKPKKHENYSESSSNASSRSTTPEPDQDVHNVVSVPQRLSRRSTNKISITYAESDENEGDISPGESDIEDKPYNPITRKEENINLSESGSN